MGNKIKPFYCGSQAAEWKCRNCFECVKGYDDDKSKWNCDIELAIDEAFMNDGSMTKEMADAMGYNDKAYSWDCPSRVRE
jgi:hypothetical protein